MQGFTTCSGSRPAADPRNTRDPATSLTLHGLYNSGNGYNCAATMKNSYLGTPTFVWASFDLSESPFTTYQDQDEYKYYAVAKGYARGH